MNTPVQPAAPPNRKAVAGKVGVAATATLVVAMLMGDLLPSENRILTPYRDSAGIWTVCMGIIGPDVWRHKGTPFTVEECKQLERAYLTRMVNDMGACIVDPIESRMTYGLWAAFGHWAYNTGTGAFCNSTLNRKLNAGDVVGACKAMANWTYITYKGTKRNCRDADMQKVCRGIVVRRDKEVAMCLAAI